MKSHYPIPDGERADHALLWNCPECARDLTVTAERALTTGGGDGHWFWRCRVCQESWDEVGFAEARVARRDAPKKPPLTWEHVAATLKEHACGKLSCECCVRLAGEVQSLCLRGPA